MEMEHVVRVMVKEAFKKNTGTNPGKLVLSRILDFLDCHRRYYDEWIVGIIDTISSPRLIVHWDAPIYYTGLWHHGEDLRFEWYMSKIYCVDYKHYMALYSSMIRQIKMSGHGGPYFCGYTLRDKYSGESTAADVAMTFHPTRKFRRYLASLRPKELSHPPSTEADLELLYDFQ